jgi:Spy/CpxP family protein refolding chaperone
MSATLCQRLLIAALATVTLASCAAPLMQSRQNQPWSIQDSEATGGDHHGRFGRHPLLRQLDLTDSQKTAVQAILAESKGADKGAHREDMQGLRTQLLAPSIDPVALEASLQAFHAKRGDHLDRMIDIASRIRDVLTPEQREKAANLPAPGGRWREKLAGKFAGRPLDRLLQGVTLTEAQQQAADALKTAFTQQIGAQGGRRDSVHQAMAAFARSGDAAALKAVMTANAPTMPLKEIAGFAASLDQSQRQQIANRMREMRRHGYGGRWHGRHG